MRARTTSPRRTENSTDRRRFDAAGAGSVVVVVGAEVVGGTDDVVVVVGVAALRRAAATLAGAQPGVGTADTVDGFSGAAERPKSWVEMAFAMTVSPVALGWRWSGLKYGSNGEFGRQSPL